MKKITILLSIFTFLISSTAMAQFDSGISRIKPNKIYWESENEQISLKKGFDEGIERPDKLKIVIELNESTLEDLNVENQTFECQWYRWGPTKKYLKLSTTEKIKIIDGKKLVISANENLTSSWWEVNIISYFDSGYIKFKEKTQFQILIK